MKKQLRQVLIDIISDLISADEKRQFPIKYPDPIDAIKFRMEQQGLRQKDVAKYFGGANKASEVLNRKLGLSLAMIRRLNKELKIPAKVLIQPIKGLKK